MGTTKCTADGNYYGTHAAIRANGERAYTYGTGDTATCSACGADLWSDGFYTPSAAIIGTAGRADLVARRDEMQDSDPLKELAETLGHSLPFAVERTEFDTGRRDTVLYGHFASSKATIGIAISRDIAYRWVSTNDID